MTDQASLTCAQLADPYKALGLALSALSKVEPYAGYKFGELTGTVMGQIQRRHYVFTFQDKLLVGYGGWALCAPETARAWLAGQAVPDFRACLDGPNPVLVTFHAKSRAATFVQIRHMRRLYPGREIFFRRDYAGRRTRIASVVNVGTDGDGVPGR